MSRLGPPSTAPDDAPPVRVLIVDDSALFRECLSELYASAGDIVVVDAVGDGEAAIAAALKHHPDIVSLDLGLPGLDGFEVVEGLMDQIPVPILVMTATLQPRWRKESFYALELGALDVMQKPDAKELEDPSWRRKACERLKLLARSPVVRHLKYQPRSRSPQKYTAPTDRTESSLELIVIAGSAGAPRAVLAMLDEMRSAMPLPVPLVIALHMGRFMVTSYASYLADEYRQTTRILEAGDTLAPGGIYLLAGGVHTRLRRHGVVITEVLPHTPYIPSFDHLLDSVATDYGASAAAVVLSGIGDDGTHGMLSVFKAGGLTLAQSAESCLIANMPLSVSRAGATTLQLPPVELVQALFRRMRR